jgi:DNA-directed RNA polymerase subunit RPC12/RpoP
MIRFNCSDCGATVKTQDGTGGLMAKCPNCRKRIRVPSPPEPVLELDGPPPTKKVTWRLFRNGIGPGWFASGVAILGLSYMIRNEWWIRITPFALAAIGILFSIRSLKENEKPLLGIAGLLLNLILAGLATYFAMSELLPHS